MGRSNLTIALFDIDFCAWVYLCAYRERGRRFGSRLSQFQRNSWPRRIDPLASFKKGDFGSFFFPNTSKLTSLAVSAYKKAFNAALDIRRVSLY